MGQGQGNGQNQNGQPGNGPQGPPGGSNGNGDNVGPGQKIKWATRVILTYAEAGKFTNGDGSFAGGAISWPKGKPFSIRGTVEYYNEGVGSWLTVDMGVQVGIQLNQSSASYPLWAGWAGTTGDGSFDASCLIPGAAAGGVGMIAIHVLGNNDYAESWLVEG
jgi:hypothetical protein